MNKKTVIACLGLLLFLFPFSSKGQHFRFTNFGVDAGMPSNEVYSVYQDSRGFMWFTTDRGVCRFDGYNFHVLTTADGLHNNVLFSMAEDQNKGLWIGGMGKALSRVDLLTDSISVHPLPENVFESKEFDKNVVGFIDGKLVVQTKVALYQFQVTPDTLKYISEKVLLNSDLVGMDLIKTIQRNLAAFKEFEGLREQDWGGVPFTEVPLRDMSMRFRLGQKQAKENHLVFKVGPNEYIVVYSRVTFLVSAGKWEVLFSGMRVYSCLQDRLGGLWLGGENGLFYFPDGPRGRITEVKQFSNVNVTCLWEDSHGGIWLSTRQEGVHYLKNTRAIHYTGDVELPFTAIRYLKPIKHFKKDYLGISYYDNPTISLINEEGVVNIEVPGGDEIQEFFQVNDSTIVGVAHNTGGSIIQNGEVKEIVNLPYIPIYYNSKTKKFTRAGNIDFLEWNGTGFSGLDKEASSTGRFPLETMAEMQDTVWSGGDFGLGYSVNGAPWKPIHFGKNGSVRVTHLEPYNDSVLAVSTLGEGVGFYSKGCWLWLNQNHGLPSNMVNYVHFDSTGSVWVGTNSGLTKCNYSPTGWQLKQFTMKHGLLSNQVNAVYTQPDRVWVATSKGLSCLLYPDAQFRPSAPMHVIRMKPEDGDWVKASHLSLPFGTNLEVHYVGLDFAELGDIKYEYRLSGMDQDWYSTNNRSVRLVNLPSGSFQFQVRVKGESNPSYWGEFSVYVDTPFWKSWWFWVLIIVVIILVILWRFQNVRKQADREKELSLLKQQALAAQMNPHFLFNSFNSIRNFILKQDRLAADKYLIRISELVRSVLNNSFKTTITLEEEIKVLENYLEIEQLRMGARFDYQFLVDDSVDPKTIELPPSVLQPFVENAIWHGIRPLKDKKGLIQVRFFLKDKYLGIEVEDNGVGLSNSKEKTHKSHGLSITRKRLQLLEDMYKQKVSVNIRTIYEKDEVKGTLVTIKLSNIYEG